jgi:hypothetical protein
MSMVDTIQSRLAVLGALNILLVMLLPLLAASKHAGLRPEALACCAVSVAMIVVAIGAWLRAASWAVRIAVAGYCAMPVIVCWVSGEAMWRMI